MILIHGLAGDAWSTWAKGRHYWPEWLAAEIDKPHARTRVLAVEYPTHFTSWSRAGDIQQRANDLHRKLRSIGVGDRPFVVVCHSMGGILIKSALIADQQKQQDNASVPRFFGACAGILFIGTPHLGSSLANMAVKLPHLAGVDIALLSQQNAWSRLRDIHEKFLSLADRLRSRGVSLPLHGWYESLETNGVWIVNRDSALADMDNSGRRDVELEAPGDHLSCCKCESHDVYFYTALKGVIESWFAESRTLLAGEKRECITPETFSRGYRAWKRPMAYSLLGFVGISVAGLSTNDYLEWFDAASEREKVSEEIARSMPRWRDPTAVDPLASSLLIPREGGLPGAAELGHVIVAATPELGPLVECVRSPSEREVSCEEMTYVMGPGGFGKGPVACMFMDIGAVHFDLADGLSPPTGTCEASSCRERCGIPSELRADGKVEYECKEYSAFGDFRFEMPEVEEFRGLDEFLSGEGPPVDQQDKDPCVLVVDSFDEVHPDSRERVVERIEAWLARADDCSAWQKPRRGESAVGEPAEVDASASSVQRMAIIFGRGESIYDQGLDPRSAQVVRLRPLYVGSGVRWLWYLADFACHIEEKQRERPDTVEIDEWLAFARGAKPSADNCRSYFSRLQWAERVTEERGPLSPGQRRFAFAGLLGNELVAHQLSDPDMPWSERLMRALLARAGRHGRPPRPFDSNDKESEAYFKELLESAISEPGRRAQVTAGEEQWSLLAYSSLVDLRSSSRGTSWKIVPAIPTLRTLMHCAFEDVMPDECVETRLAPLPPLIRGATDHLRSILPARPR